MNKQFIREMLSDWHTEENYDSEHFCVLPKKQHINTV